MKYYLFIPLLAISLLALSCQEKPKTDSAQASKTEDVVINAAQAESLAQTHCAGCHLYPAPALLDKNTWQHGTLPQMAHRMGIYGVTPRQSLIEANAGGRLVEERGIFPHEPLLTQQQWDAICRFYIENAPDSLTLPQKDIKMGIRGLKVDIPEFHITPPMITAIKYHPELKQYFVADAKADYSTINILDENLESINTLAIPSSIAHFEFRSDTILATLMGRFIPTDNPTGSVIRIFKPNGEKEYKGFTSVLKNLQRPVHTTYSDINGDKLEDIIVCEYGNHTGKLSLFINRSNGQYEKKILSPDPGATTTVIRDLNQDGLPDIIALMAQGNERIDVHYNLGDGNFNASTLVQFPPAYGSVGLSVLDWNMDGHEDLLYVNGDNADYSMTLKPYHGVRLFLNNGDNSFQEAFFQHQNGAYKAIPFDYDRDGDLDIATTAFFPDLVNGPEEGFLLMENTSSADSIHFDLRTIKEAATGRWLIMEAIDRKSKNTPDLILGAFTGMGITGDFSGAVTTQFQRNSPTLMLLEF